MYKLLLLLASFGLTTALSSQSTTSIWRDAEAPARPGAERAIVPKAYRVLQLDTAALLLRLAGAPDESVANASMSGYTLELPRPDGRMETFRFCESPIMAPGLAQRFPRIKTYMGKGVDNPTALVRLDYTPHGFHAMVLAGEGTYFIDPYYHLLDDGVYQAYFKKDFQSDAAFKCEFDHTRQEGLGAGGGLTGIGEELRLYRLAVATTGEYTQYHGGTVEAALAAVVTAMNRVNGVYERDFSVRMILVENNDLIIFTDPFSDPYSGGNQLGVNQNTIDGYIGNAQYDIGHYFDRGGGGVAGLGVVCSSEDKARGYTGLTPPVGDPFYIDYVAHEMGHQFGGNHTFNGTAGSCGGNRNGSTAFEPGSGVTIMAYAGICGGDNVASNSVDHFHNGSLQEMSAFIGSGGGNSCPVIETTDNTAPVVNAGPSGSVIPISTPFELTGSAADMEGDALTYCWEQLNLGPAGSPNSPVGNAPLFRSFSPTTDSTRVFPEISSIVNNTASLGERLPNYARGLTFRLTARDNYGLGGGVAWDTRTLTVTDQAGPFRVLSQNQPTAWRAGSYQLINWDVANTDQAPVGASMVNIYLSADGGFTYPLLLEDSLDNNGQALILVPDTLQGDQFRVKVKAVGNVFFDINNSNITIEPASAPGLTAAVSQPGQLACGGQVVEYALFLAPVLGFEGEATLSAEGLPEGVTASFENPLPLPSQSAVTISGLAGLATGDYPFQLIVSAGSVADTVALNIELYAQAPQNIVLVSPAEGEPGVSIYPELSWEANPDALSYQVEVALDPGFSDIIFSRAGITSTTLTLPLAVPDSSQVYWRARGDNPGCGAGEYTASFFETEAIRCQVYTTENLPVSLEGSLPFIISRIAVEDDVIVRDVNIRNIQGNHFPLTGLNFRFGSPEGPIIDLATEDCNGFDFNFSLDDSAPQPLPCPFNNGGAYRPQEKLDIYNGQNAAGEWRLILFKSEQNGSLDNWELEVCFPAPLTPTKETALAVQPLKVFPNPAQGQLSVELPENTGQGAGLLIRNVAGRLLTRMDAEAVAGKKPIDIGWLPEGLYFLQLMSREGQLIGNSKFVKIR